MLMILILAGGLLPLGSTVCYMELKFSGEPTVKMINMFISVTMKHK